MKSKTLILVALGVTLGLSLFVAACGHSGLRTHVTIGVGFFYDHLAAHGDWLWVDAYGWVWTPWDVGPEWRPYSHGRWVYTVDGWTWLSSWTWGWAPFHYGRWHHHPAHGWVWIPGTRWAPAWVAWRHGEGAIGWAPLPAHARWTDGNGLHWDGDGLDVQAWSFVRDRDFLRSDIGTSTHPRERNDELLRSTRDRTLYDNGPRGVLSGGIAVEDIERVAGPVDRMRLRDVDRPPRTGADRVDGGHVEFYRPRVTPAPDGRKPPASKRRPGHHGHG